MKYNIVRGKPEKLLFLAFLFSLLTGGLLAADKPTWERNDQGHIVATPPEVEERFRNPAWPDQWQTGFHRRATHVIEGVAKEGGYGNTYFENEKRSYGRAMLSILGGYRDAGLSFLQASDANSDSWHQHTNGIDFFASFTLKHQVRKYFYFGPYLKDAYRKRMYEAAKIWTEKDPLRRDHPAYENKEHGWGPPAKNSWVDVRSTDNLKLMRDVAVYLFAEETGNENVRKQYRKNLRKFITTMYYAGMGEWDSENYLGHSFIPLLNLYDFAEDPEVKRLAKVALDWMSTVAAVKYRRGNTGGPTKRDYNHPRPFGGSLASIFWLYFGDTPNKPEHFESDEVHVITSAYRPPIAVVKLARKQFPPGKRLYSCKPHWQPYKKPLQKTTPQYRETLYFGKRFQMGSLRKGTRGDVNGFKITTDSHKRGADTFSAAPSRDPTKLGSAQYADAIPGKSAVAQNRNLAIYLTRKSDVPFLWRWRREFPISRSKEYTFLNGEKTWIALRPIRLKITGVHEAYTEQVRFEGDGDEKTPRWNGYRVISSKRTGKAPYGFAIEVGDPSIYDSFEAFRKKLKKTGALQVKTPDGGNGLTVRFKGGREHSAGITFGPDKLTIRRNGTPRNLQSEKVVYGSPGGKEESPVWQDWHGGTLRVKCDGSTFRASVEPNGDASFSNQ